MIQTRPRRSSLTSPELTLWSYARRPPRRPLASIHARRPPRRPLAFIHARRPPRRPLASNKPNPRARPFTGRWLIRVCYAANLLLKGLPIHQVYYSLPIWPPTRPYLDPVFGYAPHRGGGSMHATGARIGPPGLSHSLRGVPCSSRPALLSHVTSTLTCLNSNLLGPFTYM